MKIVLIILIALAVFGIYKLVPWFFAAKSGSAYAEGDTAAALEYAEKAIKFSGGCDKKMQYALLLMRAGKFSEAEQVLNEIILYSAAKQNEKMDAKIYRCMVYAKTGRGAEALEDTEEIFEVYKNTTVYGMLAYLRQLSGDSALELCEEAYEYNADDRDICDNLAVAYIRSGKFSEAEKLTDSLRAKFPKFIEGFYHSAVVAAKKGDKQSALEYISEIDNCRRNMMTTVSEDEISELKKEVMAL